MSPRSIIALLTDFGLSDHYVGVMKGVMAGICPGAHFIDITHDIPRQDVQAGAFELAVAYRYFPAGTIFLAVVDPGVGTDRRAIAFRTGPYSFVGPDNGLFDLVITEQPPSGTALLTNPRYARALVSATFHGRDRFAPAAAWLAQGTPLEAFGDAVALRPRLPWTVPDVTADRVTGEVVHIDRFGNLISNIHRRIWSAMVDVLEVRVADLPPARMVRTYGDAQPGDVVALFGSTERLEIAVVQGHAAERFGVGRGAAVHVSRRA
ncbi:MAG: S-adenosyl-l-methionine hydroxide adenosyltransferase family protein [Vicinamibacterales bacterium]